MKRINENRTKILAALLVLVMLFATGCGALNTTGGTVDTGSQTAIEPTDSNVSAGETASGSSDSASSGTASDNDNTATNDNASANTGSNSSDTAASTDNAFGSNTAASDESSDNNASDSDDTAATDTSDDTASTGDASSETAAETTFTFTNSGITATGGDSSNYKIDGTNLTIKAAGTYTLTGSCSDGSVTVKKGTIGVTLILSGLSLTNQGTATTATAPLSINKSTGVTIVVAAGTVNTLTDSKYNNDDTYTTNEEAENAVIKCKDGSQVTITGTGTLNIVSNGKNGIKSGTTDTETDTANPRDAFLTIENATVNITTSVNDAINAEQELNILSGTLTISAADDAIHCDYTLNISATGTIGPTIRITKSYEGIEGATINVYSGDISILSSDDLMNAANSDLTNYNFSLNIYGGTIYAYSTSGDGIDSNGTLNIYGGTVEVWTANTADNSPLDADGGVNIQGGTVFAAGGSSGMSERMTATQAATVFGGSSGGMGGWGGSSSQLIAKGATVAVKDASGNTVYTATAPCNASHVICSASSMTSGSSYTLTSGSSSVGTATATTGSLSSGGMGGGMGGGQDGWGGTRPGRP